MFFENQAFRQKVKKSMQKGTPKVAQIHQKSPLGRSLAHFWPSGTDFGAGEKSKNFQTTSGRPKNGKIGEAKRERGIGGATRVRQGSEVGARRPRGGPRAGTFYSLIVATSERKWGISLAVVP